MNQKGLKAQREQIELIIEGGVKNKNAFYDALKAYMELKDSLDSFSRTIRDSKKSCDKLCEMISEYAQEHSSVFDGTDVDGALTEIRDGVFNGNVPCDGEMYHFAMSRGEVKRIDGSAMSQPFLESLPTDWTKFKLELVKSKVNAASDEDLAEHGLEMKPKYTWSMEN